MLVGTSTVGARKSATGCTADCAAPWANSRSIGLAVIADKLGIYISLVFYLYCELNRHAPERRAHPHQLPIDERLLGDAHKAVSARRRRHLAHLPLVRSRRHTVR